MTSKELSKYMINASDKPLTMGEFRELTKDIPDDTMLGILCPSVKKIYEAGKHHQKCDLDNGHEYLNTVDYSQLIYSKKNNTLLTASICKDLSPVINKNSDVEFLFKRFLHDYYVNDEED